MLITKIDSCNDIILFEILLNIMIKLTDSRYIGSINYKINGQFLLKIIYLIKKYNI